MRSSSIVSYLQCHQITIRVCPSYDSSSFFPQKYVFIINTTESRFHGITELGRLNKTRFSCAVILDLWAKSRSLFSLQFSSAVVLLPRNVERIQYSVLIAALAAPLIVMDSKPNIPDFKSSLITEKFSGRSRIPPPHHHHHHRLTKSQMKTTKTELELCREGQNVDDVVKSIFADIPRLRRFIFSRQEISFLTTLSSPHGSSMWTI